MDIFAGMKGYDIDDTICALATPEGVGAIGVIRISGSDSLKICNELFPSKNLLKQRANTLHVGNLENDGTVIDEVVLALFKTPKSYTGEDIIEISCHGSSFVREEILKNLIEKGARMAKEGEFTFRAFINGKIDLSQAEAVADLIASDSNASRDLALSQLKGGYASRLRDLREQLIHFASMLELELDFSEEDVEFANKEQLEALVRELHSTVLQMIDSFDRGNVFKNGIPVAIIGAPNVGKSTLLNQILKEDKAIVSEFAGTTRDAIEDVFNINGVVFRFIDTAGLRETSDFVENIGIQKAKEKAESAKLILHLMDVNDVDPTSLLEEQTELAGVDLERNFIVFNKIDSCSEGKLKELKTVCSDASFLSAKNGDGVEALLEKLNQYAQKGMSDGEGVVVSNVRHLEALKNCDEALVRTLKGIDDGMSSELLAMDVRQALHYLGEITGEVCTDDLLGNIFSKFCIGK